MWSTSIGGTTQSLRSPVVRIGDCTGKLIAADLALGDGHPVETSLVMSDSWRTPEGSGCTDTAVPGCWYPTHEGVRGPVWTRAGNERSNPSFGISATDDAIPGCADMVLYRLADPMPSEVAAPIKVMTSLGGHPGAQDAPNIRVNQKGD